MAIPLVVSSEMKRAPTLDAVQRLRNEGFPLMFDPTSAGGGFGALRAHILRAEENWIMGLLDGLIGGAVGAGLAVAATRIIEQHGGVQGVINQMQQHGLGDTVKSWVSTGPNQPISAERLHQVFGTGTIEEIAQRVGMSAQELSQQLAQFLPQAIDHLTPNGQVPPSTPGT